MTGAEARALFANFYRMHSSCGWVESSRTSTGSKPLLLRHKLRARGRNLVVFTALDNLSKRGGPAGQNMNLMAGLDEKTVTALTGSNP